jgi:hypothetical protein
VILVWRSLLHVPERNESDPNLICSSSVHHGLGEWLRAPGPLSLKSWSPIPRASFLDLSEGPEPFFTLVSCQALCGVVTGLTFGARNSSQVEHSSNGYGGGGIYAMEGVAVRLSGTSSVRNNQCGGAANRCGGGGIRVTHGSTLSLSGAVAVSGNVGDMGGGVFAEQKTSIRIADGVRFERNVADPNGGGAIFISGCGGLSSSGRAALSKFRCAFLVIFEMIFQR